MENGNNHSKKYCLIISLIIFITIVGIIILWLLFFRSDKDVVTDNICTQELSDNINIDIYQEPTGDYPWWNNNYPYNRQIGIVNNSNDKLPSECFISLEFDHGYLVDQTKSRGDAYDISLVYFENGKYTQIPFQILNPDTGASSIQFKPINQIEPSENNDKYFLYYGNLGKKDNKQIIKSSDKSLFAQNYSLKFSRELQKDITGRVSRLWSLKNADENYSKLTYTVSVEENLIETGVSPTYEILGTEIKGNLERSNSGDFEVLIDTADLDIGTYEIISTLVTEKKKITSAKSYFIISYPLYVVFSIDYEGVNVPDSQFKELEDFSRRHNTLPIVHFFNPRIYVTEDVSSDRRIKMTDWIKTRESEGDEIGMHLHMHYDLVEEAGVEVKTSPKWTQHLENGHDVPCSAYSYKDFKRILNWAINIYGEQGLGLPISFRAGGWFADSDVLKAVSDSGFRIDSSGRSSYVWGANNLQGYWNLGPTTRPYHPSATNQNSDYPPPNLVLWEFPNNGGDSYFYDYTELINRFEQNFDHGPMKDAQTITFLSHPHDFSGDLATLEPTYDYIDKYLADRDRGPIIYTTLRNSMGKLSL